MERRVSPFLISVLCLGIAFLYIPMAVMIGYSFNASALANVWGGFSTHWYTELLHNRQILNAAGLSLDASGRCWAYKDGKLIPEEPMEG